MCFTKRDKGFTLIELLVVIAIIAILAAILFPVFAAAKKKSQLMGCVNNLKQFSGALLLYTDDHGGWFPYAGSMGCPNYTHNGNVSASNPGSSAFYIALNRYLANSEGVRFCPAAGWTAAQKAYWGSTYVYQCAHNPFGRAYQAVAKAALCGYRASDIVRASKKSAFYEVYCTLHNDGEQSKASDISYGGHYTRRFTYTAGYVDGHAKYDFAPDLHIWFCRLNIGRDGTMPTTSPYPKN